MSGPSAPTAGRPWWQPTLSHQHGPLVALLVSFLLGAAGAQHWTMGTTTALVVVLAAFQAEHPLVQQIRRRRALQPRLLLWAGIYGAIALALGAVLAWQMPVLLVLAGLSAAALWSRKPWASGRCAASPLLRQQRGAAPAVGGHGLRRGPAQGGWLLGRLENFRAAPIGRVAAIETISALLFLLLVALALLPATLQTSS